MKLSLRKYDSTLHWDFYSPFSEVLVICLEAEFAFDANGADAIYNPNLALPHHCTIGVHYKLEAVGLKMSECYISETSTKSEICSGYSKRSYQCPVFKFALMFFCLFLSSPERLCFY